MIMFGPSVLSGKAIDAFISWGWDYFSRDRAAAIVDRPDDARLNWEDDDEGEEPESDLGPASVTRSG